MPNHKPPDGPDQPNTRRTVADARPVGPPRHITRTGFETYRADLRECGYDPDNPADMSVCQWLVHCWVSDA